MLMNQYLLAGVSIIVLLLSLAATVLAFIFIVPEKRRAKLNAFGRFIHDTLNFKYLIIEKILQALYIFATASTILTGFFMLFSFESYFGETHWNGGYGLLIMVLGPVIIRLMYEFLMLIILLVKNVIMINGKLKNQNGENAKDCFAAPDFSEMKADFRQRANVRREAQAAQAAQAAQQFGQNANVSFCSACGSRLNADGTCPNCSNSIKF